VETVGELCYIKNRVKITQLKKGKREVCVMAKGWYWRGNVAYYDFEVNGARYRGSLGIKKDSGEIDGKSPADRAAMEVRALMVQYEQNHSVEQIWEQTQKRLTGNKKIKAAFTDIWDEYSSRGMSNAGESRKRIYSSNLKHFIGWLENNHREITLVTQITEGVAKEYITWLYSQDGSPATKNDKLITMKMIFSHLGLPVNPFQKIKRLPLQQVQRDIFTPEQINILFNNSSGWMRQLFITALATFQREEDCCLIKKSYIHLDINRIKFPFTYKTGQEIDLPMLPLFRKIVEDALSDSTNDTEYLFPELARIYTVNPCYIGKKVKIFLQENGITNTLTEVPGYLKKVSTLDVHSLRHTAAVMGILAGWPVPMVMEATGQRSVKTLMRYINHISERQKENYFFQFGQGLPGLPDAAANDDRKRLADLAYSLPLEEVKRILGLIKPQPALTLN
jgi:integrase